MPEEEELARSEFGDDIGSRLDILLKKRDGAYYVYLAHTPAGKETAIGMTTCHRDVADANERMDDLEYALVAQGWKKVLRSS